MAWCEANRVDYLFDLARNERLVATIAAELDGGRDRRPGRPVSRPVVSRISGWSTLDSWSRKRRVVPKPSGPETRPTRGLWSPRSGAGEVGGAASL